MFYKMIEAKESGIRKKHLDTASNAVLYWGKWLYVGECVEMNQKEIAEKVLVQ